MTKKLFLFAFLGIAAIGLAGCPSLSPPFDTTGSYTGTFTLGAGATQLADNCNISLELTQDINALPLNNAKLAGNVSLSLACVAGGDGSSGDTSQLQTLLDGILGSLLGVAPIDLSGATLPNGTIELNSKDILQECPTGDCEKLALVGQGVDSDGDGKMDTYAGTIGGLVQVSGQIVPLIGQFSLALKS